MIKEATGKYAIEAKKFHDGAERAERISVPHTHAWNAILKWAAQQKALLIAEGENHQARRRGKNAEQGAGGLRTARQGRPHRECSRENEIQDHVRHVGCHSKEPGRGDSREVCGAEGQAAAGSSSTEDALKQWLEEVKEETGVEV